MEYCAAAILDFRLYKKMAAFPSVPPDFFSKLKVYSKQKIRLGAFFDDVCK